MKYVPSRDLFDDLFNGFTFFHNDGGTTTDPDVGVPFSGSAYGNVMRISLKFGYFILTLLFVYFIVAGLTNRTLFGGRLNVSGTFKKWLFTAFFLFVGIPMCGLAYTSLLDFAITCIDADDSLNTGATKMLASTFCNFELFALGSDGDIDKAFKYNNSAYGGTLGGITPYYKDGAIQYVKQSPFDVCLELNKLGSGSTLSAYTPSSGSTTTATDAIGDNLDALTYKGDGSGTFTFTNSAPDGDADAWVNSTLAGYASGKHFDAEQYASAWITKHWLLSDNAKVYAGKFVESFSDVHKVVNSAEKMPAGVDTPKTMVNAQGVRFWQGVENNPFHAVGANSGLIDNGFGHGHTISNMPIREFSPSPISIYNYLNTSFSSTGAVVTSSQQSFTTASRQQHQSVTLAGQGLAAVSNLSLCLSVMICDIIIGFFYALALLGGNIKRSFQAISSLPFAAMGMISAIAKVVSYTALMIIEIIGTVLMYGIASEALYVVGKTIMNMLNKLVGGAFIASAGADVKYAVGSMSTIFCNIFATLIFIIVTIKLVKIRKPVIRALESVADNVIQQFTKNIQNSTLSGRLAAQGLQNFGANGGKHSTEKHIATAIGAGPTGSSMLAEKQLYEAKQIDKKNQRKQMVTGSLQATAGIAAAAALAPVNPVAAAGAVSTAVKGAGKVVGAHNEHTVENTTAASIAHNQGAVSESVIQNASDNADKKQDALRQQMASDAVNVAMMSAAGGAGAAAGGVAGGAVEGVTDATVGVEGVASSSTSGAVPDVSAAIPENSTVNVADTITENRTKSINTNTNLEETGAMEIDSSAQIDTPVMQSGFKREEVSMDVQKSVNTHETGGNEQQSVNSHVSVNTASSQSTPSPSVDAGYTNLTPQSNNGSTSAGRMALNRFNNSVPVQNMRKTGAAVQNGVRAFKESLYDNSGNMDPNVGDVVQTGGSAGGGYTNMSSGGGLQKSAQTLASGKGSVIPPTRQTSSFVQGDTHYVTMEDKTVVNRTSKVTGNVAGGGPADVQAGVSQNLTRQVQHRVNSSERTTVTHTESGTNHIGRAQSHSDVSAKANEGISNGPSNVNVNNMNSSKSPKK